jgi:2',3'-cyclic-nucleotide 2'-phosphodiesterase (5'-nucleotidase family)
MTLRGTEVADVQVSGQPLQSDKTYKVAIAEFLLTGGNGYTTFAQGRDPRKLGITMLDIVTQALEKMGTVTPPPGGRVTIE